MLHVLGADIRDIGHGVRLSRQDEIEPRTLVCFLDRNRGFHYGFAYRNGSNLRVVCWEGDRRRNRTVPKGTFIIAFDTVTTQNAFNRINGNDFENHVRPWFDNNKQQNVEGELRALDNKEDRVNDLIERIAGLTVDEIDQVIERIDELQGN